MKRKGKFGNLTQKHTEKYEMKLKSNEIEVWAKRSNIEKKRNW